MIVLDATTKSLEVILAGAVTANQLPIVASYVDVTTTAYTPKANDTATNNTTAVTPVAAPAASTQRQVKLLTVFNADTAAAAVTVRLNSNSTMRTLHKATLAVGSALVYTDGEGFRVIDANGNILQTAGTTAASGAFTVISNTDTGAQNNWAPAGLSGNTLIEWNGASDAAITGLAGGVAGQIVEIKNVTTTKIATFAHASGSSSAANRFTNTVTGGLTPIAAGGSITYQHDGTNWQLVGHEQGAWITRAFAAGNFVGTASMTWTVGSATTDAYRISGRTLTYSFDISGTIGGTPNPTINITLPNTFGAVKVQLFTCIVSNGGTQQAAYCYVSGSGVTTLSIVVNTAGVGNWTAGANIVYGTVAIEVS